MENVELSRTKIHEQAMICIFQYLFYETQKEITQKKKIEEIISDVMEVSFDECDLFFRAIIFETISKYLYLLHSFNKILYKKPSPEHELLWALFKTSP